jgi:hypothetical protein
MVVLKKSKGKKGKSKSKNMRGGAIGGKYNFPEDDEIYFFSDLEGNMPNGIKELMFETTTLENGEKIFEMDATGIIEKPKSLENKVIVFTGDLIDRGEYSIRNLKRMLALKEKDGNAGRVILLCGNRDTNKIRMYHECHIQKIEDNIFNNEKKDFDIEYIISKLAEIISDFKDTPDTIFTNKSNDIATIINIPGILKDLITPRTDDTNFVEKYKDNLSRIKGMYSNTLGSPNQVENFKKEFIYLFEIGDKLDDNETLLLIFIAMMNMVMGKIWGNNVLPIILEPYNGLYIKYLQQCHIMASITIGNKLCFVSHAGIPYTKDLVEGEKEKDRVDGVNIDFVKDINEIGTFYIPNEVGVFPSTDKFTKNKTGLKQLVSGTDISSCYNIGNITILNDRFTRFITSISNGHNMKEYINNKVYKQYVAMSANCDILQIEDTEYSAYASPVVSRKTLGEVKDMKYLSLDKFIKEDASTKKVYNIFGHQPSGALPYISKTNIKDITSYHIDLDISKVEDNDESNKKSYVYLKMTKDSDMLFGKTESTKVHDIINKDVSRKEIKNPPIDINYNEVTLDSYCENSIVDVTYNIDTTEYTSTLFTVDIKKEEEGKEKEEEKKKKEKEKKYYGMFLFTLVETNKEILPKTNIEISLSNGGRGKRKIYTKSIKRFLYGKRKMVIYVGKRGGEYVKVKGEYVSLAKFNNKIKNKKK